MLLLFFEFLDKSFMQIIIWLYTPSAIGLSFYPLFPNKSNIARKKHSTVESAINSLQQHGCDFCPDYSQDSFERYTSTAIVSRNLIKLGDVIIQKERKKLDRKNTHSSLKTSLKLLSSVFVTFRCRENTRKLCLQNLRYSTNQIYSELKISASFGTRPQVFNQRLKHSVSFVNSYCLVFLLFLISSILLIASL